MPTYVYTMLYCCALFNSVNSATATVVDRATWHNGESHGAAAVHRFASFHLDRIDLSSVAIEPCKNNPAGEAVPVMRLLQSTIEHSVPDWIEQVRRLGGLLIGVSSQTARPISLAHEWAPIARQALAAQHRS